MSFGDEDVRKRGRRVLQEGCDSFIGMSPEPQVSERGREGGEGVEEEGANGEAKEMLGEVREGMVEFLAKGEVGEGGREVVDWMIK